MTSFERSSLMAQLIYQLQIKWAGNVKRRRTLGKECEKEIRLNKIADPGFFWCYLCILEIQTRKKDRTTQIT